MSSVMLIEQSILFYVFVVLLMNTIVSSQKISDQKLYRALKILIKNSIIKINRKTLGEKFKKFLFYLFHFFQNIWLLIFRLYFTLTFLILFLILLKFKNIVKWMKRMGNILLGKYL